ncbi:MAG: metallophosphoesterase [Clostridia bacterium]|nr:metallophosphoesterase [Clostridia bacterium]
MMKKRGKKLRIWAAFAASLLLVLIFAFDVSLHTVTYTVKSDKLSASFTAVLLTDLHSCRYGENQQTLIRALSDAAPDAVFLAGDIIDDKMPPEDALIFLSYASERYPCYYVSGNHEFWRGDIDAVKNMLKSMGIHVLSGEAQSLIVNGQTINVCGVDDPETGEDIFAAQLKACVESISDDTFTLLLSHRPERIYEYANLGFNLVLSGHAHGGQLRLWPFIDGLYAPNQGFFPKFAGGMKACDGTPIIISRGLARGSTRFMRIFNPPELIVIKFLPACKE